MWSFSRFSSLGQLFISLWVLYSKTKPECISGWTYQTEPLFPPGFQVMNNYQKNLVFCFLCIFFLCSSPIQSIDQSKLSPLLDPSFSSGCIFFLQNLSTFSCLAILIDLSSTPVLHILYAKARLIILKHGFDIFSGSPLSPEKRWNLLAWLTRSSMIWPFQFSLAQAFLSSSYILYSRQSEFFTSHPAHHIPSLTGLLLIWSCMFRMTSPSIFAW